MSAPTDKPASGSIIGSAPDDDDALLAASRAALDALANSLPDLDNSDGGDDVDNAAAPRPVRPLRPSPTGLLPQMVLDRALGSALKRRLRGSRPVVVVVQAPGADWCSHLKNAANHMLICPEIFARDGSKRNEHRSDVGNDDVASALCNGRHVLGIASTPDRVLPTALIAHADARVVVKAPDGAMLKRLIRDCVGRPPHDIPDDAAAGLGFHEIVAAFRNGSSPAQVVAALVAASSSKCRATATDDTPPLDRLPGCDPALRAWGLRLADDYTSWKRNDIPWKAVIDGASIVVTGPPGTGKTTFAKSLAATMKLPLVATSVGDWFANSPGFLDSVIKSAQQSFDLALSTSGVWLLDEVDGIPNRNTLSNRGRDWWLPVINYLLLLLDSAQTCRDGMVIVAATNMDISFLDPALVRPGRLSRHVHVAGISSDGLAEVLRFHLGPVLPGSDLASITRLRPDATPALAAQWARDTISAARAAGRDATLHDLVAAVAPRDDLSDRDRRVAAVHEAGHAVVGLAVGRTMRSVSTLQNGRIGGMTVMSNGLPAFATRADIEQEVLILLAGRAAEQVVLGAASLGAVSDLNAATALIATLHASGGLGADLLHRAAPDDPTEPLTHDPALRKAVAKDLARVFASVVGIVLRDISGVTALADALVDKRFLDGDAAADVVRKALASQGRHPLKTGSSQ